MGRRYLERKAKMTDYIERNELIKNLKYFAPEHYSGLINNLIMKQPAADVEPVVHGRWIEPTRLYYGAKQYECSLCYSDTFWKKHSITEKYPHCPNCGATMDLDLED